jgi:protein TonB
MGWEGTVLLRMEIGADGMVTQLRVQRSSGHRLLDQAAIAAAQRWRFAPETDGGFTMRVIVDVPVRFDLADYAENEPLQ